MNRITFFLFPLSLISTLFFSAGCTPANDPSKSKAESYLSEKLNLPVVEVTEIALMDSAFFQTAPRLADQKEKLQGLLADFSINYEGFKDSIPIGSFVMETELEDLEKSLAGMNQSLEVFDGVALEDGIGHAYGLVADMSAMNAGISNQGFQGDSLFSAQFSRAMALAEQIKEKFIEIENWGKDFFIEDLIYHLKYKVYQTGGQVPYWVSYKAPEKAEAVLLYDREKGAIIDHAPYPN